VRGPHTCAYITPTPAEYSRVASERGGGGGGGRGRGEREGVEGEGGGGMGGSGLRRAKEGGGGLGPFAASSLLLRQLAIVTLWQPLEPEALLHRAPLCRRWSSMQRAAIVAKDDDDGKEL
jgi:hypothetical protein